MEDKTIGSWAMRRSDIPANWPKNEQGEPEQAAYLKLESELCGMADITISILEGCGIPAFKSGTQGKVLCGYVGVGVELYVPASQLEEAKAILESTEFVEESPEA